jgi:hypothetical protein
VTWLKRFVHAHRGHPVGRLTYLPRGRAWCSDCREAMPTRGLKTRRA